MDAPKPDPASEGGQFQTDAYEDKIVEAIAVVNAAIALDRAEDIAGALEKYEEGTQRLVEASAAANSAGALDAYAKIEKREKEVMERIHHLQEVQSAAIPKLPLVQHIKIGDMEHQLAADDLVGLTALSMAGGGFADAAWVAARMVGKSALGTGVIVGSVVGTAAATGITIVATLPVGIGYLVSPGFRRFCDFWWYMLPLIVEYRALQARAWLDDCNEEEYDKRTADFHQRTAPKVFDAIISMKGIFVKIGQMLSTVGMGIIEDAYVQALKPLQDGLPPRSLQEISKIIEEDVGERMSVLFQHFEPEPVGAASIGQAHRAILPDGREIIVKVQYPEVAELYGSDFDCMEMMTSWLKPELVPMVQRMRERNQAELDFRNEAEHLREIRSNMIAHDFEPRLVRVPQVVEDRLCTKYVLAMEYLDGISMKSALKAEADQLAVTLGFTNGEDMRMYMAKRLIAHLKGGSSARIPFEGFPVQTAAKAAAALRIWVRMRQRYCKFHNMTARFLHTISGQECCKPFEVLDTPASNWDLGKTLKDLIQVHGCQLLLDGVFNVDPHPGNVLLLNDGRIGLIDYGLVGRLDLAARLNIAQILVALAESREDDAALIYAEAGHKVSWPRGEPPKPNNVLKRIIRLHFDRFDLSPIDAGEENTWAFTELIQRMNEEAVPEWIAVARRLTGLLIGVANQAGRPVSLVREWEPIARSLLKSQDNSTSLSTFRSKVYVF